MNEWSFVVAAYGMTVAVTGALIGWAWRSMRQAEAAAEQIKRK